jgi:hypothetical protein
VIPEPNKISLKDARDPFPTEHVFAFHRLFDKDTKQDEVYGEVAAPMIPHVYSGYNSCIFAYGQTGSGKTYSMYGRDARGNEKGLVPRTAAAIFNEANARGPYSDASIAVSLCEIYCDRIRDLGKAYALKDGKEGGGMSGMRTSDLYARATTERHGFGANDPNGLAARYQAESLEIREDGKGAVYVKDLTILPVRSVDEVLGVIEHGFKLRATHGTKMNSVSSRSHTIFTFHVTQRDKSTGQTTTAQLNMVDLAGSERLSRSESTGQRLLEAQSINSSLSALGMVVAALQTTDPDDGPAAAHIPYRDSKLTRVLQNSLGGNSYTSLLATVHPRLSDAEETLFTLHFANRCQAVLNRPRINYLLPGGEDVARRLRQQDAELAVLRHRMMRYRLTGAVRIMRLLAEAGINGKLLPDGRFSTAPQGVTIGLTEDDATAHPYVTRALALLAPEPSEEDNALYEAAQETRATLLQAAQAEAAKSGHRSSGMLPGQAPMTDAAIEVALHAAIGGMATSGGVIGAGALPSRPNSQTATKQGGAGRVSAPASAASVPSVGSNASAAAAQQQMLAQNPAMAAAAAAQQQMISASHTQQPQQPQQQHQQAASVSASRTSVASTAIVPMQQQMQQPIQQMVSGAVSAMPRAAVSHSAPQSVGWAASADASATDLGFDSQASLGSGSMMSAVIAPRPVIQSAMRQPTAAAVAGPAAIVRPGPASAPSAMSAGRAASVASATSFASSTTASFSGPTPQAFAAPLPMPAFAAPVASAGPDLSDYSRPTSAGGVSVNRALARAAGEKLSMMAPAGVEEYVAEIAKLKNRVNELKRELDATKAKAAADLAWQHKQAKTAQDKAEKARKESIEQVRLAKEHATKQAQDFNMQVEALLKASTQMVTDRERVANTVPESLTLGFSASGDQRMPSSPGFSATAESQALGLTSDDPVTLRAEYTATLHRMKRAADEAARKAAEASAKDLAEAYESAETLKNKLMSQLAEKTKEVCIVCGSLLPVLLLLCPFCSSASPLFLACPPPPHASSQVGELRAQLHAMQSRLAALEQHAARENDNAVAASVGLTLNRAAASRAAPGVALPTLSRASSSAGTALARSAADGGLSASATKPKLSTSGRIPTSDFTASLNAFAGANMSSSPSLPRSSLIQAWEAAAQADGNGSTSPMVKMGRSNFPIASPIVTR